MVKFSKCYAYWSTVLSIPKTKCKDKAKLDIRTRFKPVALNLFWSSYTT